MKRILTGFGMLVVMLLVCLQIYVQLQEHPIKRIVHYVVPGITNGRQDGSDWNNAYPSLAMWVERHATDCVGDGVIHVAYISPPENDYCEVQHLTWKGWVVDERHYPEVIHATP